MIIFLLAVGCNVCQQLDFKSNGAVTLKSMCCTAAAAASDLHRADLRGNELVRSGPRVLRFDFSAAVPLWLDCTTGTLPPLPTPPSPAAAGGCAGADSASRCDI